MFTDSLEQIGLTKGEIKTYLALLESGSTSIGTIMDKTNLQKSTIYFCLNQLIEKGLVGHVIKNNRKIFEAGSPDRLLDFLERKEKRLFQQKQKVEEIIPQLYGKMNLPEKRESAKIFEGWNGMKSAFDELFKRASAKDYLVFAVSPLPSVTERFRRFIFKTQQKRIRLNIAMRGLINEEHKETIGKDREKESRTKVRYVPKELSGPAAINVYGDWVLIALWADPPSAFIIENEEVANSFRNYFDMLWKNAFPR